MTERSRRVVLLIDYDNLQICAARDTPGRDLQLPPVVQLAQRYGTVILARAYAEWNLSTERLAVYKAGIEPAFAPVLRTESDRSGKSLADTVMVAEGMDMLWTLSPEVVVLATSDKDLIPLVRVAKQRGAFVVVLGSDFTAIPLREMADEHVTYRQLITDSGVREAGAGRSPAALPEPSRRRHEREGRERASSPVPAPVAAPPPAQPRPEREAAPATSQPAGVPASAEPVAPFTSTAPGEADSQSSGRRRRRRGSRRRSDRLGLSVDGGGTESSSEFPDGEPLEETEGDPAATSAEENGVPAVVDGEAIQVPTPETSEAEANGETEADAVAVVVQPVETPVNGAPVETEATARVGVVPDADGVAGAASEAPNTVTEETPATPQRRPRRTRRRVADTADGATSTEPPAPVDSEAPAASADTTPPPEEALPNGTEAPGEPSSTNGASAETPAEPARRPRRVASASRGRSRRP